VNGELLSVTCSIGVACNLHPGDSDIDFLIREADMALYQAKAHGRDCVESACCAVSPEAL
jgi:diguanylate cyclase (GGDEF)-like protein